MAKLSDEETAMLKRLTDKQKAPDTPPVGRVIQATVDLGNPEQIALAIKHGFLTADEAENLKDESENGGGGEEENEAPSRRGYFG